MTKERFTEIINSLEVHKPLRLKFRKEEGVLVKDISNDVYFLSNGRSGASSGDYELQRIGERLNYRTSWCFHHSMHPNLWLINAYHYEVEELYRIKNLYLI